MLNRRQFMLSSGAALGALALSGCHWWGHQDGSTYIGMSRGGFYTGNHAMQRIFQQWGDDVQEHSRILENHAADRIPWVSFKPPSGGWAAIINGSVDAAIRAKAQRYAAYPADRPVLTTFHHEPWGEGTPADFEAAFFHILDVMVDEVGSLGATTYLPIFNGFNIPGAGEINFASGQFVERCPVIGFDHYSPTADVAACIETLLGKGIQQLAIGEFGRGFPDQPDDHGLADFEAKLNLFRQHRNNLSAVCFFNSREQNFETGWPNGAAYQQLWDSYASETARLP